MDHAIPEVTWKETLRRLKAVEDKVAVLEGELRPYDQEARGCVCILFVLFTALAIWSFFGIGWGLSWIALCILPVIV
jgi:hypothetical protein